MNTPTDTRRESVDSTALFAFFRNVMVCLGHHGWMLECRDSSDSYCWLSKKKITLGLGYKGDPRQILLHEIAHIDTCRFCNNKHTTAFWKRCEYLVRRFLKTGLDENQIRHREFVGGGVYALCYANNQAHP